MGFFSKCDQTPSFLRIWSYLLKKFLMENFSFCVVNTIRKKTHKIYLFLPPHKERSLKSQPIIVYSISEKVQSE